MTDNFEFVSEAPRGRVPAAPSALIWSPHAAPTDRMFHPIH